ncbi:MAG: HupE/UreJ family protein, partial [Chitinophagaceae bacterium]
GLIHGLGFANAIRFMLASDQHIGWALFGFNLGLEAGQIVVVTGILMVCYIVVDKAAIAQKWWVRILSSVSAMMAIWMAIQRWPW